MDNTINNLQEKLNRVLQEYFNQYHSDVISTMIFDDSVSVNEFARKLSLISMCEEIGIDEFDTINNYYILIDEDGNPVISNFSTLHLFDNMEEAYAESVENESVIYLPTYLKLKGII